MQLYFYKNIVFYLFNYIISKIKKNPYQMLSIIIFTTGLFICCRQQTAFPVIKSGAVTFQQSSSNNFVNITYVERFSDSLVINCASSINGLEFQSVGMTSQVQFNFYSQIADCGYNHITFFGIFDAYLKNVKISYFAFGNEQALTQVVFLVFNVKNGTTTGSINDHTQFGPRSETYTNFYSLSGSVMPAGATNIVVYPCLQAIQIGTSKALHFQFDSLINQTSNSFSTSIYVYDETYIKFVMMQAILFNYIQFPVQGYYNTNVGGYNYFPGASSNIETLVSYCDQNYFYAFKTFLGFHLDLTNISIVLNGTTMKSFFVDDLSQNNLHFTTNFMRNTINFPGSSVYIYYLIFTKYTTLTLKTAQNNVSDSMITIIIAIIISILVVAIASVIIYKKCDIAKRLKRKQFQLKSWENIRFQA